MEKELEQALATIEKKFGKGSVMRLGEKPTVDVGAISTRCLSLDMALGIGGVPKGRIVEIFGPESSGKTTLALQISAAAQSMGGRVAYVDAEHALDPEYAEALGVDPDELLVAQPDSGEQALEIVEALIESGKVSVIVVDSVAALVPQAELNGDMGDSSVGVHARLMSKALRKLVGSVYKTNTCLIFINQLREKIGVMFGSPETTTGGRALKFYASVRIDIRRIGQVKQGEELVGSRTRIKIVKNKVAPPFKEVECDIMWGEGISRAADLLDLALEAGIIKASGSWFSMGEDRLGQGRENVKKLLKEDIELYTKVEELVKAQLSNKC